jgi:hypothetical protein
MTVVTGAAGVVVAVTTGAVPVPLVSPGDAHERDGRAEPVTLFPDSHSPSPAPEDGTGSRTGADSGMGAASGTSATATSQPSPSGIATPGQGSLGGKSETRSRSSATFRAQDEPFALFPR